MLWQDTQGPFLEKSKLEFQSLQIHIAKKVMMPPVPMVILVSSSRETLLLVVCVFFLVPLIVN